MSYPWPTWLDTDDLVLRIDDPSATIRTNGPTPARLTVPVTQDALAQLSILGQEGKVAVLGASPLNRERLARLSDRRAPIPVLATAELDAREVTVTAFRFPYYRRLDEPLRLGVDDALAEGVSRQARSRLDVAGATAWLTRRFLSAMSEPDVLLVASHLDPTAELRGGMQIHAREATAHISVRKDTGAMVIERITPPASLNPRLEETLQLIAGDVTFVEEGYASRAERLLRGLTRARDDPEASTSRYMETWRHYEEQEARLVLAAARRLGAIRYVASEGRSDERWELVLANPVDVDRVAAMDGTMFGRLAVYQERPMWLNPAPDVPAAAQLLQAERPAITAEVVTAHDGTVVIDIQVKEGQFVPASGQLTVSLAGHATQIGRRAIAREALVSHPDLQLVLADQNVELPGGRRRRLPSPLPAPVLRAFDGRQPNSSQLEALKLAYESGGLVAVQGPPGTGKTSVVAALQQLYAEQGGQRERGTAVLVSATQHDAVDNVLDKSSVFGLPPIKHGRGGDHTARSEGERVSAWARARAQHVERRLAEIDGGALAEALLRATHLAQGYLAAAMPRRDTARLLLRLSETFGPDGSRLLPGPMRDELAGLARDLERESLSLSDEARRRRQSLRRAAALIRTSREAFDDDGPDTAIVAEALLRRAGRLEPAVADLLAAAARGEDVLLEALGDLKLSILDVVAAEDLGRDRAVRDERATTLLTQVLDFLGAQLARTPSGRAHALVRYRERLRDDVQAVDRALLNYLVVVGATAQGSATLDELLDDDTEVRLVVVDEAARANPLDLLIPLVRALECKVVVGDHRQLPQLVDEELVVTVSAAKGLSARQLLEMSLFERLYQRLNLSGRAVTLREQYRMHPLIGEFVSDTFYPEAERFRSPRPSEDFPHDLRIAGYERRAVRWLDVAPSSERRDRSVSREAEASAVVHDLRLMLDDNPALSFGLICMYSAQVALCWKLLGEAGVAERGAGGWQVAEAYRYCRDARGEERTDQQGRWIQRLRVGTVDAFQGREFDVVFVSLVRSNTAPDVRERFGFTLSPNRLNVAMSRAKRLLVIAGDSSTFGLDVPETQPVRAFMDLCTAHEAAVA